MKQKALRAGDAHSHESIEKIKRYATNVEKCR